MGKPVDRKSPEAHKARPQNEPLYTAIGERLRAANDTRVRLGCVDSLYADLIDLLKLMRQPESSR